MNIILARIIKSESHGGAPNLVEGQAVEAGSIVKKNDVRKVKSMTGQGGRYILAEGGTKDDYILRTYSSKESITDIAKYAQSSTEPWDEFLNSVVFKKISRNNYDSGVQFDGKYYTTGKNGKNKSQKYKLLDNTLTFHNTNARQEATVFVEMENVNDKYDRKGLAINFDVQGYRYQKCNEVQDGYEVTNDTVLILDADSIENVSFKPYDIESVGHTEKDDVNYYFSNDRKSKDKKDFEKIFYSYKRAFNSRPIKTRNKSFMKAMEKYGIEEDQIDSFIKEAQRMGSALDSATSAMAQKASGEKFNYKDKEFQILCDTIKGMQRDNSQIKENENGEYGTSSASTISMCLWLTGYIDSINGEQISAQELLQKIATYAK